MLTRVHTMIKMMQRNPIVIKDEDNTTAYIAGLIEFNNPYRGLACCFDTYHYELNECVITNNVLHCSDICIGRVLHGIPDTEQIKRYNEDCLSHGEKIKCIHLPNGDVIMPI